MGIQSRLVLVVVVALSMMRHESVGQSARCSTMLISLYPCLNYVTPTGSTSSSSNPSSSCCSRLATVVQSQPRCLCSALNGGAAASLGVTINQTRALALPAACHLQTPSPTHCNDASEPAAPAVSPVSSPESSSVESSEGEEQVRESPTAATWEAAFPSAIIGSKSVPITTGGIPSSGRSLINTPFYLISVALLLTPLLS